jgi:hypothetical protein
MHIRSRALLRSGFLRIHESASLWYSATKLRLLFLQKPGIEDVVQLVAPESDLRGLLPAGRLLPARGAVSVRGTRLRHFR